MKVTRVILRKETSGNNRPLAICSVVLDDSLMLSGICLYKGSEGYYLILPSKQDVYQTISSMNEGISIKYPPNYRENYENCKDNKKYEEYYHPVTKELYNNLLMVITKGYEMYMNRLLSGEKKVSYRPK